MLRLMIACFAVVGLLCAARDGAAQTKKAAPSRAPQAYRGGDSFMLQETCLDGYAFLVLLNRKGEPVGVTQFMEYRGSTYPKRCGEGSRP